MKKAILFFLFITASAAAVAQLPAANDLHNFNQSRNTITSRGLKILGGWAVANVAASSCLYFNTTGSDRAFNQMNVLFNGVNVLIAGASLLPKQKNDLSLERTLQWQSNTESTYIANAALDLLYSSVGLYLTEKAKNDARNHDRWNGWGDALIMNGCFLFLFDTTMFTLHKRNGKKLYRMMDKVSVGTSGLGIHIGLQL